VIGLSADWNDFDSETQPRALPAEDKGKRTLVNTWVLSPSDSGYWLSRAYSGTSMIVFQRLSDKITFCEVEYNANFAILVAKRVSCR
jgi:hypothetical protein